MDATIRALGEKLLAHGSSSLSDRERRLLHRLAKRLETAQHRLPVVPLRDRIAERISLWAGSWVFIGCFLAGLIFWIETNTLEASPLDPFPFPFLNLCLSILAPTQALLILMAQNRQVQRSRAHIAKDYAVNLRTAVEVAALKELAGGRWADQPLEKIQQDLRRVEEKIDALNVCLTCPFAGTMPGMARPPHIPGAVNLDRPNPVP